MTKGCESLEQFVAAQTLMSLGARVQDQTHGSVVENRHCVTATQKGLDRRDLVFYFAFWSQEVFSVVDVHHHGSIGSPRRRAKAHHPHSKRGVLAVQVADASEYL